MKVERTAVMDEYVEDGESVVMLPDGRVLALSAVATEVLALVGHRSDVAVTDLAKGLVECFGPPPDDPTGVSTTRDVVRTLSESGLLNVPTS